MGNVLIQYKLIKSSTKEKDQHQMEGKLGWKLIVHFSYKKIGTNTERIMSRLMLSEEKSNYRRRIKQEEKQVEKVCGKPQT